MHQILGFCLIVGVFGLLFELLGGSLEIGEKLQNFSTQLLIVCSPNSGRWFRVRLLSNRHFIGRSGRKACVNSTTRLTMNCEVFQLKELELEHFQIREVLRCILHTIMFHRALGLVRPRDVDLELFEVTYVQCGDPELERNIEEKIDLFIAWVEKHPNKKGQVCLSFFETRNKQTGWFGTKVERFYWEQWCISLNIFPPKSSQNKSHLGRALTLDSADTAMEEKTKQDVALETALREVLFQILQLVNDKKDHIPPVLNSLTVSFPYEISIPSNSDSSFGKDMLKRMLQTGPPTMLS